jgi:hypothetical protein
LLLVSAAVGVDAHADRPLDEPFNHDGFQFRGAIGAGYMTDSEAARDGSFGATIAGVVPFTFEVYVGGAPTAGLTLGGTLNVAGISGPSVSFHSLSPMSGGPSGYPGLVLVGLGPYVDWYPDPHAGFHAMALGLGVMATPEDGQVQTSAGSGFAVGAGLGYDWWVHRRWSVGVLARLTYAWPTTSTQSVDLTSVDNRVVSSAVLCSVVFQ